MRLVDYDKNNFSLNMLCLLESANSVIVQHELKLYVKSQSILEFETVVSIKQQGYFAVEVMELSSQLM